MTEIIETLGHISPDGVLNLSVQIGVPDTDVAVTVQVRPLAPRGAVDAKGWPIDYFESVPGSMPELERAPQGSFELRFQEVSI